MPDHTKTATTLSQLVSVKPKLGGTSRVPVPTPCPMQGWTLPEMCPVTESQNHRLVWVGRDLTDHPVPPPCPGQGPLPPAQDAPSPVQPGLQSPGRGLAGLSFRQRNALPAAPGARCSPAAPRGWLVGVCTDPTPKAQPWAAVPEAQQRGHRPRRDTVPERAPQRSHRWVRRSGTAWEETKTSMKKQCQRGEGTRSPCFILNFYLYTEDTISFQFNLDSKPP